MLPALVRKHAVVAAATLLWIPAVGYGINKLMRYSSTPGQPAAPPEQWPHGEEIQRTPGAYSIIMFAHPQCECTRASLGELAIIMAHANGRARADVLVYRPKNEPLEWTESPLWKTAGAIPDVHVQPDENGRISKSFGAYTSGQTLLYDPAGRLLFKGGITAFRGHSGDNAGRSAITALLAGKLDGATLPIKTPVFGCSLRGD